MNIDLVKNIIENNSYDINGECINLHDEAVKDIIINLVTLEQDTRQHKKYHMELRKSKEELNALIDECYGGFYFCFYNKFNLLQLENQYLFRFVYLCTFMDYNNLLHFGKSKNSYVNESDIQEILNLSKREFQYTKRAFAKFNILKFNKYGQAYINRSICKKGKIATRLKSHTNLSTRVFSKTIKILYNNSIAKDHKRLGLLIKLLPFVHVNRNILCYNPYEQVTDQIQPIDINSLKMMLGYSSVNTLKKGLLNLFIDGEAVVMLATINYKVMILVNPKVYFKGNSIKDLKFLMELFTISSK